jgi:fucose 4-O-acetylase-like acetyltransferase
VAVALGAGWVGWVGRPFSLSRTLVWFPLFLTGHRYGGAIVERAARANRALQLVSLACLAACGSLLWFRPFNSLWIYEADSYLTAGFNSPVSGLAFRAGHLVAACVLGLAALCLVPTARSRITVYGSRTLTILVVHPLLVRAFNSASHAWSVLGWAPFAAVIAAGVTWASGMEPFHRLVTLIYELPGRWKTGALKEGRQPD